MTIAETQQGTEIAAEPRRPGGRARRRGVVAVGVVAVVLAGAAVAAARDGGSGEATEAAPAAFVAPTTPEARIASAMLAAPTAVSADATILDYPGADLAYPKLRAGTNDWTCFPDYPATPVEDPLCVDVNGKAWADAYFAGKPPKLKAAGVLYMLRGSGDFSMTDPFATKLEPGHHMVNDGPHISIVSPTPYDPKDYSAHGLAAPSVMWAGSPYEHLHVPVR